MPDQAKIYFVITIRGDQGPFTMSDISGMLRAGELQAEDQVRTAFGRNLGTVAECLRSGKSGTTNRRPVAPSVHGPSGNSGRLVLGIVGGLLVLGGLILVVYRRSGVDDSVVAPAEPPAQLPATGAGRTPAPASGPPPPAAVPLAPPPAHVPLRFHEANGFVVMEAEHAMAVATRGDPLAWVPVTTIPGFTGDGYMSTRWEGKQPPNTTWTTGAELQYAFRITMAGDYRLWMRVVSTSPSGNSAYIGIDGQLVGTEFDNLDRAGWRWVQQPINIRLAAGDHLLQVRRREPGYGIDRILLGRGAGTPPSGVGPPESAKH